jgi:glycosyltransferase involved in cell wall biosynthesis
MENSINPKGALKLFYLSKARILSSEARSVHVMKMCAAFAAHDHQVTLFSPREKNAPDESPFAFYDVPPSFQLQHGREIRRFGKLGKKLWRWRLRGWVRSLRPDLIYGRDWSSLLAVAHLGVPFIYEAHWLPELTHGSTRLFVLPNFKRLVVISEALRRDFLDRFSELDESKVWVAHDGADPVSRDPQHAKAENAEDIKTLSVGYVGQLYTGKGIEIIEQLASRCPWAHFHIVGGRPPELASWKSRLAPMGNVIFHGFVPHRETARYLRGFDVVVAPYQPKVKAAKGLEISRWTSPLKLFEYMAHAKPIIASDLPVLREVLSEDQNALLVPPSDLEAWTHALERLRDDPKLRHRLGDTALANFEAKHTWSARADAVLSQLEF